MRLFKTPAILPALYPTLTWRRETSEKEIYLTFDDGPVPGLTEFVLDKLKEYNAAATFFCIGDNISKHGPIFQQVLARKHAVGNHTFNHLKGWSTGVEEYVVNVSQCSEIMAANDNFRKPRLFRPPYGRIKRSQIRSLSEYEIVMWDVLTYDYDRKLAAETCLKGTIKAVRPGSVIVLHDSTKAEKNMTFILPRLLQHFSDLGYTFKSL